MANIIQSNKFEQTTILPTYLIDTDPQTYHIPTTTRRRRRWYDRFLRDLKDGIESRYPLCCVLDFSLNEIIHRNDTRWIGAAANRPGGNKEYVLCYIHYWLATRKHKPLHFFEQCVLYGHIYFSCISCKAPLVYLLGHSPTWNVCPECGRALLFVQNSRRWRHYS